MNDNPKTASGFLIHGFSACGAFLLPSVAQAHPGHNPSEAPPSHLLFGPDHLGVVMVAGVVLFCFVQALRWRKGLSS